MKLSKKDLCGHSEEFLRACIEKARGGRTVLDESDGASYSSFRRQKRAGAGMSRSRCGFRAG